MSRLSYAFLAALALHGALLAMRLRHAPHQAPLAAPKALELEEIELAPGNDPVLENAPEPSHAERATGTAPLAAAAARTGAAVVRSAATSGAVPDSDAAQGTDSTSNGDGASNPNAASSAQASAAAPAPTINLHLDDGFFARPAGGDMLRVPKPEFQRQLEASILADNVQHGLARGNVLLSSLNEAVRGGGPVRGSALLSVTVDAGGSVATVELVRGSASEWASALDAFRAMAARKHLRVPPGAHGLRVTFSVQSKVQLPSGQSMDAAGNVKRSGIGLSGTFDVADIGALAQRMVSAHVVTEEAL